MNGVILRNFIKIAALALVAILPMSCGEKRPVMSVPGWEDEAAENLLERRGGAPVTESSIRSNRNSLRCARLNNYFCIKNVGWQGNVGEDSAGHTAFRDPVWSARAAARDLRRKYERGNLSAVAIANAYAPWTDTVGSRRLRAGELACTAPEDPADLSHCEARPHCNCPPAYAAYMVEGTGLSITDDLGLLDARGEFNPIIYRVLRNMSGHEVGFAYARSSTIREGVRLERRAR